MFMGYMYVHVFMHLHRRGELPDYQHWFPPEGDY